MIGAGGGTAHQVENRRGTEPNLPGLGLEGAELRLLGVETPVSVGLWSKETRHASPCAPGGFSSVKGFIALIRSLAKVILMPVQSESFKSL